MPKHVWITRTAAGEHEEHTRSKDGFYRGRGARSTAPTKAKAKDIKLKDEYWTVLAMRNFFLKNEIHANRPNGWLISFHSPNRKMTPTDQLDLLLQPDDGGHLVEVNYNRKHLVIRSLELDPEEQ